VVTGVTRKELDNGQRAMFPASKEEQ
jgi:hypothetical protein